MKKNILANFENNTVTIEFGYVASLCLWLGNESSFGNIVREDKQRQTKTCCQTELNCCRVVFQVREALSIVSFGTLTAA